MSSGPDAYRGRPDEAAATPERVFISYAHDDAAHEDRVRDFWLFLREQGVDARADLSAAERRQDWAEWMTSQVRDADRVLVVASPEYRRRAEGDAAPSEGRGVQWEARLIRDRFYADQEAGLQSIVPVVLPGCAATDIPLWMGRTAATYYQVSDYTVVGAEKLLRLLTGQPWETEPPLGRTPVLPARQAAGGGTVYQPGWPRRRSRLTLAFAIAAIAVGGCAAILPILTRHPLSSWTYKTRGAVVSSPDVVGGMVYVASNDHNLYALDAATGGVRWEKNVGSYADSSPTVVGGTVYIGSWLDDEVYALDAKTGRIERTFRTGDSIDSSPVVAGGILYVGCNDHYLYAFDADSGGFLWRFPTHGEVQTRPAVSDGIVYFGSYDGYVYALHASSGVFDWKHPTGGPIKHSSPAVAKGTVYIGSWDGKVYALDAATGTPRWQPYATGDPVDSTPAVADGSVYVGSQDGRMYALSTTTGAPSWQPYATGEYVSDGPVVADGAVYFGSYDRYLYALNAVTGALDWKQEHPTGGHIESSPAVANGMVYFGSDDDKVYALSAATGS